MFVNLEFVYVSNENNAGSLMWLWYRDAKALQEKLAKKAAQGGGTNNRGGDLGKNNKKK